MGFFGETASAGVAAGKTKFMSILRRNERYQRIETTPNPPDQLDIPRQSEKEAPESAKKKRFEFPDKLKRRLKSLDLRKRGEKKETTSTTEVVEPPAPPKNDFSALMPRKGMARQEENRVLESSVENAPSLRGDAPSVWKARLRLSKAQNSEARALEQSKARRLAETEDATTQRTRVLKELKKAEKPQLLPKDPISEEEAARLAQSSRGNVDSGLSEGQIYNRGWTRTEADRILPKEDAVWRQRAGFELQGDVKKSGKAYSGRAYDKVRWHERLLPEARKAVDRTTTSVDDMMALHAQQERLMSSDKVRKMSLEEFETELAAFEAKTSPEAKEQLLTTYSGGPYGSSWTPRDALMDKRRDAFLESAEAAFKKKHAGKEYSSDRAVREQYSVARRQHIDDIHKEAYEKYPTTSPLEQDKDGNLQIVSHTYKDIGHQAGPNDTRSNFDFFSGISPQSFKQKALEAEGLSERDYSSYAFRRRGQISDEADMKHQQALQKLWNSPKNIDPEKLKLAAQAQQDLEKYPEWQQAVASVEKGESNNINHWFIKNGFGIDHRAVKLWRTTYDNSPHGVYERVVKARSNPSKYTSEQEYT